MEKRKVIHTLYAGLGGHANVVFPLLETKFGSEFEHILVFYGVEPMIPAYAQLCEKMGITYHEIQKKRGQYLRPFSLFRSLLKKVQPHAIIVHNSELIITAARFAKQNKLCKAYYVEHQDNNTKSFTLRFLTRFALKKAETVICLSENFKSALLEQYTCKVPVKVIPNGVNTRKFCPQPNTNQDFRIGMASRMSPTKDHKTLLNAFKILLQTQPEVKLDIAGHGDTLEEVKTLCTALALDESVRFVGLLNEDEMISFYQKLDLFALATTSETMSTALLQAMSCALPVLTSDIENNKILIEHGVTGWLYKDQNAVDLAEKLSYIIENRGIAIETGIAARNYAIEHYSLEKMGKNYTALIE